MNTIEGLRARVRDAALGLRASMGAHSDAKEALRLAQEQDDVRAADCANAEALVNDAEAAYLADQSAANEKAVLKAQDAARLAGVRRKPTTARLEVATRTVNEAAADVARNRDEHAAMVEALEYEEKLAVLRHRAEPSTLSDNVKPHWEEVLTAIAMLQRAGAAIFEARLDADSACAELRNEGEAAPDPDSIHTLLPLLVHEVSAGRTDFGAEHAINQLRYLLSESGINGSPADLPRVIFDIARAVNEIRLSQREFARTPRDAAQRELAIRANTRTAHEADLLRHDLHRAGAAERQAEFERTYLPPTMAFGEMDVYVAPSSPPAKPAPTPTGGGEAPQEAPGIVARITSAIASIVP